MSPPRASYAVLAINSGPEQDRYATKTPKRWKKLPKNRIKRTNLTPTFLLQMRPTTGPMRKDGVKPKHAIFRNSSQPPKGMHINHDDLVALATGPPGQGEGLLRALDREIVSYKRLVQNNKQMLSSLRRKARERDVEPYRWDILSREDYWAGWNRKPGTPNCVFC